MGGLDASDEAFLEKFENCGFEKACWTHEAHVRMAWSYFSLFPDFSKGLEKIRSGIVKFNASLGGTGYHETVTVAFARVIHARLQASPSEETWAGFLAKHRDLLSKESPVLLSHYSPERLAEQGGKTDFLSPDRRPLPLAGRIRLANPQDAAAILRLYGPIIEGTAVSFEVTVPSPGEMEARIESYLQHAPWFVFEAEGKVVGYAYASPHRAREAYRWTVEVSAYVDPKFHQRGIARLLYGRLFAELEKLDFFLALAGITLPNPSSVSFHEALGFHPVGTYPKIGFKLGTWHDVGWWQRPLKEGFPTPPKKSNVTR